MTLHAYRFASELPCFVTRGLLPAVLTATPPPVEETDGIYHPEVHLAGRRTWTTRRDAFTDGSGGEPSAGLTRRWAPLPPDMMSEASQHLKDRRAANKDARAK